MAEGDFVLCKIRALVRPGAFFSKHSFKKLKKNKVKKSKNSKNNFRELKISNLDSPHFSQGFYATIFLRGTFFSIFEFFVGIFFFIGKIRLFCPSDNSFLKSALQLIVRGINCEQKCTHLGVYNVIITIMNTVCSHELSSVDFDREGSKSQGNVI